MNHFGKSSNRLLEPRCRTRGAVWAVRVALMIAVGLSALPLCTAAFAAQRPTESDIKAAYLLNFAKLVTWPQNEPSSADGIFLLGIVGDDELLQACRRGFEGKDIGAQKAVVVNMSEEEALAPSPRLRILFLASDSVDDLAGVLEAIGDRPILSVSDDSDFMRMGGSILLASSQGRIVFDINRHRENASGLKISSRLLRVARKVFE